MLGSAEASKEHLKKGQPILGHGWKEVQNFDDLEDLDEYESDEEEVYVVMDLGTGVDHRAMLAENTYQLIGLDKPVPFLKLGNQIYQGEVSPLVGDEIIFGRIRNEDKPHQPSRPPWHVTSHRLAFRPITLKPKDETSPSPSETVLPAEKKTDSGTNGQPSRTVKNNLVTVTSTTVPALPLSKVETSEAGPSRRSPEKGTDMDIEQINQDENTPAPAAKVRKEISLHLRELQNLEEVMAIMTIKIPATTRFRLNKELTDRFSIQTTPDHAIQIQTTGYSQKDLANMVQGKPLRGKGSRIPRGGKHRETSEVASTAMSEGEDEDVTGQSKGKGRARGDGARGRGAGGARSRGRGQGKATGSRAGKSKASAENTEGHEEDFEGDNEEPAGKDGDDGAGDGDEDEDAGDEEDQTKAD